MDIYSITTRILRPITKQPGQNRLLEDLSDSDPISDKLSPLSQNRSMWIVCLTQMSKYIYRYIRSDLIQITIRKIQKLAKY